VLLHDLLLLPRDPAAAVAAAPLIKRDFESWLCGYESGIQCMASSSHPMPRPTTTFSIYL
jgi:hypothetical protein